VDGGEPIPVTPDKSGGFVLTWVSLPEGDHVIELTAVNELGIISKRACRWKFRGPVRA
jgi:hypothetical protein